MVADLVVIWDSKGRGKPSWFESVYLSLNKIAFKHNVMIELVRAGSIMRQGFYYHRIMLLNAKGEDEDIKSFAEEIKESGFIVFKRVV